MNPRRGDPCEQFWWLTDLSDDPRNLMWLHLAQRTTARGIVAWEERSRHLLGQFSIAAAHHAGDALFTELNRPSSAPLPSTTPASVRFASTSSSSKSPAHPSLTM